MSYITKEFTDKLDLKKLQDSDNTEWTAFIGYFSHRLHIFVRSLSGGSRFDEDIVANTLADIYITRQAYESAEHMVKHMFANVRFTTYNMLYRDNKSFLMDDDALVRVDSMVSRREEEEMSLEDRERYEYWKDEMCQEIERQSDRLPRKWKEFIITYLQGNRQDVRKMHKELSIGGEQHYKNVLQRIKNLIEHSKSGPASEDQLDQIRLTFRYFSHRERLVFSEALQCESLDDLADKVKMDKYLASETLGRCIRQLRKVWDDPMMDTWASRIEFVHSLRDERILSIVQEELIRKDTLNTKHVIKLTRGQIMEVVQMREQLNLPWSEISRRMNIAPKTLKRNYLDETIEAVSEVKEIPLTDVLQIRKLHRSGEHTITSLAARYDLPRGRIIAIIEGMDWKIVGSKVVLERREEGDDKAQMILKLFLEGEKHIAIARKLECGIAVVRRVIEISEVKRPSLKERIQQLVKQGLNKIQIANQLKCSVRTVESYAA
jgi:DNA-directed RNA polymerase specialized sigma24 family protein